MAVISPYTQDPYTGPFMVFPNHTQQILSNCIHILGVSILAYCFARRTDQEFTIFFTKNGWANLSWTRLCVILLFFDSWVFLAFSGILVNGVGLSYSNSVCSLGIYACITFYAGSKALIYCFLAEKVWVIWCAGSGKSIPRRHSRIYRICFAIILGYIAVFSVMIIGRIALIRDDGMCVIGLEKFASIPLLSYDLFVNVFLTSLFIWPLFREKLVNRRLRGVALRTLSASAVALTTSSVNICILTILHGKQLGWVCLGSCATDVTVNALVIFWVTAGTYRDNIYRNRYSLPPLQPYSSSDDEKEDYVSSKAGVFRPPNTSVNQPDNNDPEKFRNRNEEGLPLESPTINLPTPMAKAHFQWIPQHFKGDHDLTLLSPLSVKSNVALPSTVSILEPSPLTLESTMSSPINDPPISACSLSSQTLLWTPQRESQKSKNVLRAVQSMVNLPCNRPSFTILEETPEARNILCDDSKGERLDDQRTLTHISSAASLHEVISLQTALSEGQWTAYNELEHSNSPSKRTKHPP